MQAMGAAMTQEEFRALIEKVMDDMVADGTFRVVGIDHLGRKRYVRTAAVKRPAFDCEHARKAMRVWLWRFAPTTKGPTARPSRTSANSCARRPPPRGSTR